MQFTTQRTFLSGLALLPAIAALALPDAARAGLVSVFGLSGTLTLWAVLAFGAVHLGTRVVGAETPAQAPASLLRASALRNLTLDLPSGPAMRVHLQSVLGAVAPACTTDAPEAAEDAIAVALARVLATWEVPGLHALGTGRLTELYLLDRLMRAQPDMAGRLSQLFADPSAMLDLRDRIAEVAARRARFDREHAVFDATLRAWRDQPSVTRPNALLLALQALEVPDIDLWHRVVLCHDPRDPAQREAALWCVRQPECDAATVACYLAFLAADGHLDAAARGGDTCWLRGVLSVIEAWNAGRYTRHVLGLEPVDAVTRAAPVLSDALDRLAIATDTPRWPQPRGLFTDCAGRPARARSHWCLRTGRITAAPDPVDYFDAGDAQAA